MSITYSNYFKTSNHALSREAWALIMSPTHLKEHLHLERREPVALLHSRVPLEEGTSSDPPAYPLDGDHFAVGGHKCSLGVLPHKGGLDACGRWKVKHKGRVD